MKRKTIGKRVLSISMAAVMVVSLSACGGKNGEQEEAIAASNDCGFKRKHGSL